MTGSTGVHLIVRSVMVYSDELNGLHSTINEAEMDHRLKLTFCSLSCRNISGGGESDWWHSSHDSLIFLKKKTKKRSRTDQQVTPSKKNKHVQLVKCTWASFSSDLGHQIFKCLNTLASRRIIFYIDTNNTPFGRWTSGSEQMCLNGCHYWPQSL